MPLISTDIGTYIVAKPVLASAVIIAAAGNDNVAVDGLVIDRFSMGHGLARSMKLVIEYKAVLAASATLAFTVILKHAATYNIATPVTFGAVRARHVSSPAAAAVTAKQVITALSLTSGGVPATVVLTDSGSGSTLYGVVEVDFNLDGADQYIRPTITANLSAGSIDTVAVGATMIFGGFDELPL